MESKKTWLITGASQGLGLTTVKHLLSKEQTVIATTRDASKFDAGLLSNPNLEVVSLDIAHEATVKQCLEDIVVRYQHIDVLVNNAGYGFTGAVEEASAAEIEQAVAINVFASLRMLRYVLPHMRRQRSGHIISLSSMAGLLSSAGWGIYNLSKYAIEGFSEALYHELKPLGIHVTLLEPGAFRTNFLAGSLAAAAQIIGDYADTAGKMREMLAANNGHQPNDPEKAAAAIYELASMPQPPLRLLLGKDAYDRAQKKLNLLQEDFERMKSVTFSTGF